MEEAAPDNNLDAFTGEQLEKGGCCLQVNAILSQPQIRWIICRLLACLKLPLPGAPMSGNPRW